MKRLFFGNFSWKRQQQKEEEGKNNSKRRLSLFASKLADSQKGPAAEYVNTTLQQIEKAEKRVFQLWKERASNDKERKETEEEIGLMLVGTTSAVMGLASLAMTLAGILAKDSLLVMVGGVYLFVFTSLLGAASLALLTKSASKNKKH